MVNGLLFSSSAGPQLLFMSRTVAAATIVRMTTHDIPMANKPVCKCQFTINDGTVHITVNRVADGRKQLSHNRMPSCKQIWATVTKVDL